MKARLTLVFWLVIAVVRADFPFPFAETTISGLQEKMKSGELTSVQLTTAYLQRIPTTISSPLFSLP